MIPLSVLDLAPITSDSNAGEALVRSASLAQRAEELGYKRYWMAEHHSMPGIASAATAVALSFVGSKTSTIRIGSGGVMLPNHAPLIIAEQFGTLEALFPGRVDLGLGRAPGTDQAAAFAIRRNLRSEPDSFPADVVELMSYFRGDNSRVRAIPGEGATIPVYILGSSLFGAEVAAMLGLPYAFASHFAPQMMIDAIALYRERFEPSEQLDRPYVMLGFNCFAAPTDEEARFLSTSVQQAFVALRMGRPTTLPAPSADFETGLSLDARAMLSAIFACSAIGSPGSVRKQVEDFVARTRADELIVTSQIYDHDARLRSYEILVDVVDQRVAAAAT